VLVGDVARQDDVRLHTDGQVGLDPQMLPIRLMHLRAVRSSACRAESGGVDSDCPLILDVLQDEGALLDEAQE
jgi:hypothetical protein